MTPGPTPFGPGGQPTAGVRPYLAAILGVGALAAVPIMLADRAPGFFDRVTDTIEERWLPDLWWDDVKPRLPEADVAMHLVLFAGLALLVGLLSWSWRTFVLGQVGLALLGVALELAQPVVTSDREIQVGDVVANLAGQVLGVVTALGLVAVAAGWRRRDPVRPEEPR